MPTDKKLGFGTIFGAVSVIGLVLFAILAGPSLWWEMGKELASTPLPADTPPETQAFLAEIAWLYDIPWIGWLVAAIGPLMLGIFAQPLEKVE